MEILKIVQDVVWGPVMLVLLLGTGLYLTVGPKLMPWRKLAYALGHIWKGRRSRETDKGEISLFNALMTA